jgi:uncharacterized integral membrane protein
MNFKMGMTAVLAFLTIVFLAQNMETVTVRFLIWNLSLSLAVLIFLLLLVGLTMGWLLRSFTGYLKNKKSGSHPGV